METSLLVNIIEQSLKKLRVLKLEDINSAIKVTDEIIFREPDSYSAYKAKLILLLAKESGHSQVIDDHEIEELLNTMTEFDLMSGKSLRKEALLISKANSELFTLEDEIEQNLDELQQIENEIERDDDKEITDNKQGLFFRKINIETKLSKLTNSADEIEKKLEEGLLSDVEYLNEDLIEIPLYRALAKGKVENVIEEAHALLEVFPDSVSGHYFLIYALEQSGRINELLEVFMSSALPSDKLLELEDRLNQSMGEEPKNYWKRLR
ncbi:MAG: hypothetical protein HOE90_02845 [Bacteriovoracaceae bacterium]|jgi:hypothetical protein|nr:hypothetical protein [Bacteriovoracaceae bacterium]